MNQNIVSIEKDLQWLESVLNYRFSCYLENPRSGDLLDELPPDLKSDNSVYSRFVIHYQFNLLERLAIIMTLAPHIRPQVFDIFLEVQKEKGAKSEFGGWIGKSHGGFLPTIETLAFVAGGANLDVRFSIINLFDADHFFAEHDILSVVRNGESEPFFSSLLTLSNNWVELFTIGKESKPSYSSRFPAKRVETNLNWDDLVISENVEEEIQHITDWIKHKDTIYGEWGFGDVIKPGYKALFYGPPGTGKTFTASLIGKATGKDVYKIDLSMVSSKWVGETEKNLARIFDTAESRDWILFFDEADSLFGKRSSTQSSQERYANQEVSYLLQRTEDFDGTVILASNLKGNMDEAFTRRFQSIIYFPVPKASQRLKIWNSYFKKRFQIEEKIDFEKIAKDYEISGASIVNVLKYCAIKSASIGEPTIYYDDLITGIRREIQKEGKFS